MGPYFPLNAPWPIEIPGAYAAQMGASLKINQQAIDVLHLFISSFRRHRDIVLAKQKRSGASLDQPEAYFTCEPFGFPLILLTVEGPRSPQEG